MRNNNAIIDRLRKGEPLVFRHFKGEHYVVKCLAIDSEDRDKWYVVYHPVNSPLKICARELGMFMSPVDHDKYPDVEQEYRFELVETKGN